MKTLAIITPSIANGGAERIISTISQSPLFKKYYSIKIVTFDNSSNDYSFGCEVINLQDRFSKELNSMKLIKYLNYFKIIHKVKREMNFDIVVSFMENLGIVNAATKKNEITIHAVSSYLSSQYSYSKRIRENIYVFLFRLLIKIFFNRVNGILCISNESKRDLIQTFKIDEQKIEVSFNPHNINMIRDLSREEVFEKSDKLIRIVTMGSLVDVKAHWNLLRAFKEVESETKNVELLFIGRGENEQYLKQMTEAYNLNDKVKFIGYVTNPFKYIRSSDLYVLSSIREGLPNALIEAMACGLPVISTDCSSGPREILAPKTDSQQKCNGIEFAEFGILVPTNNGIKKGFFDPLDEQELLLKEAINRLVIDKNLREVYAEKSLIRSCDFDEEIISKLWLGAIDKFSNNERVEKVGVKQFE